MKKISRIRIIIIGCMLIALLLFALSACAPQAPKVAEENAAGDEATGRALEERYPSGLDEALEDLKLVEP